MINLDKLFYPNSIAVIGATEGRLKWGSIIFTNILDGGFNKSVYPVTSSRDSVYGIKAYKSLKDIPGQIDLVFIATPAITVLDALKDCAEKNIHYAVIISSGFSEVGGDGIRLEQEIADFARLHSINLVGPNTMGISNVKWSLFGTGAHPRPQFGKISIIAQSGNVGNQIMLWAELQKIGISKFIGSGNEAVLEVEDYLEYLNNDNDTNVILIYLEGVDDGRRFLDVAKNTSLNKPVIVLKAGRTEGGSRAAQSHTGAMTGSNKIFESVMRQTGIITAKNPTELLELSIAFDSFPMPKGNRVGIVTIGGGWGVIAADECEEHGLYLPPLPDEIKRKFDEKLPSFWSKANPVDLVGHPNTDLFTESIEIMVSSSAFDAIIVLGVIGAANFGKRPIEAEHRLGFLTDEMMNMLNKTARTIERQILETIMSMMNTYHKPIYPVSLALFPNDEIMYTNEESKYKVIVYKTPEMAVKCLSCQYQYSKYLQMHA